MTGLAVAVSVTASASASASAPASTLASLRRLQMTLGITWLELEPGV